MLMFIATYADQSSTVRLYNESACEQLHDSLSVLDCKNNLKQRGHFDYVEQSKINNAELNKPDLSNSKNQSEVKKELYFSSAFQPVSDLKQPRLLLAGNKLEQAGY